MLSQIKTFFIFFYLVTLYNSKSQFDCDAIQRFKGAKSWNVDPCYCRIFYLTLLFYAVTGIDINAQNTRLTSIEDTYIFKAEYRQTSFTSKCPCEFEISKRGGKCRLYEINITDVMIQRDSSVFTKSEFNQIKYLVANVKSDELKTTGRADFIATNSSSTSYLAFVDLIDFKDYPDSTAGAYFVGITTCVKYNLWQKFKILLRINDIDVYNRRLRKNKIAINKFDGYILKL